MAKLTSKQQVFIDEYFKANMNATEAANRAYNVKNRQTAGAIGVENLQKPLIRAEIEKRLAVHAMTANEVLFRLAEQARGNVDELLDANGTPSVDIARERGKMHLIKKIKTKTFTIGEETVIEQELEIHDSQSALVHLGRYHKLFTDKYEHGLNEEMIGKVDKMAELFKMMREREAKGDGNGS